MASTAGLATWKKYFEGKGDIDVVLKKKTTLKPVGKHPAVTVDEGETILLKSLKNEKDYLSYAGGKTGPKVIAWIPIVYKNKEYLCTIENMGKPSKSGKIDLKLQTSNMLSKGKRVTMELFGEENVDCAVFTKASDLASSCNSYIKTNKLLDKAENFKKSLIEYFDSSSHDKIKWKGTITNGELAEFAKYIGEVCTGLILLENKTSIIGGSNPFAGKKVKRMIYPMSESFKGADSVAELSDGTLIPISSKAGTGAAASFFGNLFLKIVDNQKFRPSGTVLKKLYESAAEVGVGDERTLRNGAKKIIYEYGIRNILGIGKNKLKDTYTVFDEFKKFDKITQYSPEVRLVFSALESKMKNVGDKVALDRLDESTTVFFCKTIANEMNSDTKSMDLMMKILGEKAYYQFNLDLNEVKKGNLKFNAVKSGGGSLKIIGTKSAYTNIDASQGTLNYIIE